MLGLARFCRMTSCRNQPELSCGQLCFCLSPPPCKIWLFFSLKAGPGRVGGGDHERIDHLTLEMPRSLHSCWRQRSPKEVGLFLTHGHSIQICPLDAVPSGDRDLLLKYVQHSGLVLLATHGRIRNQSYGPLALLSFNGLASARRQLVFSFFPQESNACTTSLEKTRPSQGVRSHQEDTPYRDQLYPICLTEQTLLRT